MNRVAIIQSNYVPWKGYFDIIHDVDLFVFLDDVQYTKNDWRNRNKIKTASGTHWLTVPVGKSNGRLIHEVDIVSEKWSKSHWKSLKQNYSKSPHFEKYQGFFEHVYLDLTWANLSELNQYLIKKISQEFLGITTKFEDSRRYKTKGEKLERLLDLLTKIRTDYYVTGPAAKDYIIDEQIEELGIELHYKDYSGYPEYPQLYPPFEHSVTILDLLFNCGPDAPYFIWGWRE